MSIQLLNCPHCGGEAKLARASEQVDESQDISQNPEMRTLWVVECAIHCQVYTDNQDGAISMWNTRVWHGIK